MGRRQPAPYQPRTLQAQAWLHCVPRYSARKPAPTSPFQRQGCKPNPTLSRSLPPTQHTEPEPGSDFTCFLRTPSALTKSSIQTWYPLPSTQHTHTNPHRVIISGQRLQEFDLHVLAGLQQLGGVCCMAVLLTRGPVVAATAAATAASAAAARKDEKTYVTLSL